MNGSVVTFYSYKGGVGRSFLLANIAVLLSKWGYKVLCVDWDVEAPGLDEYFRPWLGKADTPGLVDLVTDYASNPQLDYRAYVSQLHLPASDQPLELIHAGRADAGYMQRVQGINWRHLYDDLRFGEFLEKVREHWTATYDFVLVDSRTGVTDIGGICTVQLPDLLVFLFTANEQSLAGVTKVVRSAIEQRSRLPLNRAGLATLPVTSRFDARGQDALAKQWLQRFAAALEPFYAAWLGEETPVRSMLDLTRLPYFSAWSFGERLATLEERENDPESISYYMASIAALIARRLANSDQLVRLRDVYVDEARTAGSAAIAGTGTSRQAFNPLNPTRSVFVSHSKDQAHLVRSVAEGLKRLGVSAYLSLDGAAKSSDHVPLLHQSTAFLLFTSEPVSPGQLGELLVFSELAAADSRKTILMTQPREFAPTIVVTVLGEIEPSRVHWLDPAQLRSPAELIATLAKLLLPNEPAPAAVGVIPPDLLRLANEYLDVQVSDYDERVQRKNSMAQQLGGIVLRHDVSRKALAASRHNGLLVALAEAAKVSPERDDLDSLLTHGLAVTHLHAAFRVLVAAVDLSERTHLHPEQRAALHALCDGYEKLAAARQDSPLASLVATARRRVANLS